MIELRTVLWDLDGTLVDSPPLWRAAEYDFLGSRGLFWSDEHSERLIGGNLERVSEVFAQVTGERFSVEELRGEMGNSVLTTLSKGVPWMPGAVELVECLGRRKVRQGIVTSSYRDVAEAVAAALPPLDRGVIVTREDVETPKPSPEPYLLGLELAGVRRGVLAIEDSDSGIASALAAGLPVLAVGPASSIDDRGLVQRIPTLCACDTESLPDLLARLELTLPG